MEIMEKVNPSKLEASVKNQESLSKTKIATESCFAYSKLPVVGDNINYILMNHKIIYCRHSNLLNVQERIVELIMDASSSNMSLGISIKGGTDFNLPILISKIIAGQRGKYFATCFII